LTDAEKKAKKKAKKAAQKVQAEEKKGTYIFPPSPAVCASSLTLAFLKPPPPRITQTWSLLRPKTRIQKVSSLLPALTAWSRLRSSSTLSELSLRIISMSG
jgi:hypothetical protein